MTENAAIVIGDVLEQAALPQWLNEAGALLLHLGPSGVPGGGHEAPAGAAGGGYAGIDGVVSCFRICERPGVRAQGVLGAGGSARPRAIRRARRKSLAQQSAMSRLLSAIPLDRVRELGPWLLREGSGSTRC